MDQNPLDFVTTETLLSVLKSRLDSLVVLGTKKMTGEADDMVMVFHGSLAECLGLTMLSQEMLKAGGLRDDEDTSD